MCSEYGPHILYTLAYFRFVVLDVFVVRGTYNLCKFTCVDALRHIFIPQFSRRLLQQNQTSIFFSPTTSVNDVWCFITTAFALASKVAEGNSVWVHMYFFNCLKRLVSQDESLLLFLFVF